MARHNKMAGAGAALLALVIALAVALTGTMVGLGSASASATAGVSSASTTSPTDTPTDDPTVSPTPTPVSAACQEVNRRGLVPVPYGGAYNYTKARITPVDSTGTVYVDLRKESGSMYMDVSFNGSRLYDRDMEVEAGDCVSFRGARPGRWMLSIGKSALADDFSWTYKPTTSAAPKLGFSVRHLKGQKYRLVWSTQRVTLLKAVLVRKNGHVIRTVLKTSKAKGSCVIRVAHPTRKRLRVVATGPGGRESRLVAFPRR